MSDNFWLVIDIPQSPNPSEREIEHLKGLANCHLKGVRGISDSKEILTNFFGVARNAAIFMKADRILPYNDLYQIPYDDPDALLAENMALLARIFNKENDRYARQGIMLNIAQYATRDAKKTNQTLHHTLTYYGPNRMADRWQESTDRIDDLKTLVDFFEKTYRELYDDRNAVPRSDFEQICLGAIRYIGRTYSDEGEWIVRSDQLVYPVGCFMLVKVDTELMNMIPEWEKNPDDIKWFSRDSSLRYMKNLLDNIRHYGLDRRYHIKYIDSKKWDDMRAHLWNKRQKN